MRSINIEFSLNSIGSKQISIFDSCDIGDRPIHYAVRTVNSVPDKAPRSNAGDIRIRAKTKRSSRRGEACIFLLLAARANPNAQNEQGNSPLHLSCLSGSANAIHQLMDKGGNPSLRNHTGYLCSDLEFLSALSTQKRGF